MACWSLIQLVLNMPGVYNQLGGRWYLVPPVLGALAAALHGLSRLTQSRPALVDLFESYHFGVFVLRPLSWLSRGVLSLLNAFFGGTFGVEGGTFELSYATLPRLSRYLKLFIEERQTFVICTLSASLSVALGAPFAGGLLALELANVLEARVRANAVLAALVAYGTATLLQSTLLSGFFVDGAVERLNVLGVLFSGTRPASLELAQWAALTAAAGIVGLGGAGLAWGTRRALTKGNEVISQVFGGRTPHVMLATGLLMGLSVWLVPESFAEPWRAWEDLAWARLSSPAALVLLVSEWVMLVLAFSGWGSTGIFSPILLLGALFGYAAGNAVGSSWALPMAFAGAASTLAASFNVPLAASALILEIGHDAPMWWLATVAVVSASAAARLLRASPLHEALLEKHGIRVIGGRAANLLATLKARDAMYRDFRMVPDDASLVELRAAAAASHHNFLGVSSMDGKYLGLLALERLPPRVRHMLYEKAPASDRAATLERVVEIRDLIDTYNPTISPEDSCEKALELLQSTPCLAVVDETRNLCGFLFESSIAGRYKREVASQVIKRS
jgi:CIC family chloride channel protein